MNLSGNVKAAMFCRKDKTKDAASIFGKCSIIAKKLYLDYLQRELDFECVGF